MNKPERQWMKENLRQQLESASQQLGIDGLRNGLAAALDELAASAFDGYFDDLDSNVDAGETFEQQRPIVD